MSIQFFFELLWPLQRDGKKRRSRRSFRKTRCHLLIRVRVSHDRSRNRISVGNHGFAWNLVACTANKFTVGISGRILNQLTSEKITAEREACNSRQLDDFYDGRFFFRGNNVSRRRFVNPVALPSSRHVSATNRTC